MSIAYTHLMRIVDQATPVEQRLTAIRGFAEQLEWTPSYEFHGEFGVQFAEDHLVVEHGLENSAIISFLKSPCRAADLDSSQLKSLLSISYNNLIEWHIFVSENEARFVNNLDLATEKVVSITRANSDKYLSGKYFDEFVKKADLRPRVQACDDVFIQLISRWKRLIKADLRDSVENSHISALFNSIIFVRGCEDRLSDAKRRRVLLSALNTSIGDSVDISDVLNAAFHLTDVEGELGGFVDIRNLKPFECFDKATAFDLFKDFYKPSNAGYDFDFSLMSKHALSRIYEKYVSILEFSEDDRQLSFLGSTPVERSSSRTGSYYTPQFIAGFFARYIRDNMTPKAFRAMKTIDPACGSGIFLRTVLELQCNPMLPGTTPGTIQAAFSGVSGIDRDPNACEATRLSLALLHLAATGSLPKALAVTEGDAIRIALEGNIGDGQYQAVLANPPFVKLDHLTDDERELYKQYLGEGSLGRIDSYIPFVKLCLNAVEPGGLVCLVLPQAFLTSRNTSSLRSSISDGYHVRCLVDLAAVPVFEGLGAYSILLILQRKLSSGDDRIVAQIARVQEFVGPALQACLDGRQIETPYYSVFNVDQSYFNRKEWSLLGSAEITLMHKLGEFKPISTFLEASQGYVSGADDVFILDIERVPRSERALFPDFLADRQIGRFELPERPTRVAFYPYEGGRLISEEEIRARFPWAARYLAEHQKKLKERKCVSRGGIPWWRPERPRDPDRLLRPKIVFPHLMLTPKFAVDEHGKYIVSHSPFFTARQDQDELLILKYFACVLNSSVCHWYISAHAPKYSRGYNRLEVALVRSIPVPDPARIAPALFLELIALAEAREKKRVKGEIDARIDEIIFELYGVSKTEKELLLGGVE